MLKFFLGKNWKEISFNQRVAVLGVVVVAVFGLLGLITHIEIKIYKLETKVKDFEAQTAEINNLRAEVAQIKQITVDEIRSKKCGEGQTTDTFLSPNGIKYNCRNTN